MTLPARRLAVGLAVSVLAGAGSSRAAPEFHNRDTFTYELILNAAEVVPTVHAPKAASGSFRARLVIIRGHRRAYLSWKLTLSGLSPPTRSSAVSAHIHMGRPGGTGPTAITLCAPCRSSSHGYTTLPSPLARRMSGSDFWPGGRRRAYVDVHTEAHPDGELRAAFVQRSWRGDYATG